MKQTKNDFYIFYNSLKAAVTIRYFADHAEFLVTMENKAPVAIYRQSTPSGHKVWVSASGIAPDMTMKLGMLIDEYLRSLAKKVNT